MLISAQDLVKKSANLYKDNFNLFFKLAFLVTIPSIITTSLVGALTAIFGRQSQEFFVTVIYGLFFIILFIISYVIGIWFSIVKVRIIAARYENKDIASIIINILFTPFLVASQVILYSNLKNTMATENSISVPNTTTDEPPF